MKSFPKLGARAASAAVVLLALGLAVGARAALDGWVQNLEAKSPLEAAFFRAMWLPEGAVFALRPAGETRPELSKLVAASPADSDLLALRALEDERALDFTAAEADWKKQATLAKDHAAGALALADFYHRRNRGADEIQALLDAAQQPAPDSARLTAPADQRSWRAFQRVFPLVQAQALPPATTTAAYRAWIARYPAEAYVYTQFFGFLLEQKDFAQAEKLIEEYRKAFPADEIFPVKARALLEYKRGSVAQGLAIYDQSYQPLWPPELVQNYFDLLKETHALRSFLDRTRAAVAANPDDLRAATRLFYYYQQQGNLPAAARALAEYRLRKEASKTPWTSEQLYTLARLSQGTHDYNEAARYYYALYSLPGGDAAGQEKALAGIIDLLLSAPEQPLRIGAGDLSMYQDIATLDRYPGFLNGILSLILNSTEPEYRFSEEEQASTPYFHRAKASELLALFDQRFPNSAQRAGLHARLLDAYATYGENQGVIRGGRDFLAAFPNAPQRTQVALLMADAFARTNQVQEEFAIYDSVLKELSEKAGGVPLGTGGIYDYQPEQPQAEAAPAGEAAGGEMEQGAEGGEEGQAEGEQAPAPKPAARRAFAVGAAPTTATVGPRSPEYARVLDRYIARLVSLKRLADALTLYRREIDRNANDPGLYERLANFLQQNRMDDEVEQVYRRAMQQFPERSWYQKLARWYLRQKRESDYETLTRQVVQIFSGTELAQYFQNAGGGGPQLYLELNLYAHQRFPHNPVFVENLLGAYLNPETQNVAAWEALIREYWFYDPNLRDQYFRYLSDGGRLQGQLAAIRQQNASAQSGDWDGLVKESPAAAQFLAEGEAWRSHFEAAAPVFGALARAYPTNLDLDRRASAIYRSLAAFDPKDTQLAVAIEENLSQFRPGDRDTLARIGDIYADREMFRQAQPYWDRMPALEPGNSAGYLEAATVYWDYYMFDDALRLMEQGRSKLKDSSLYSYEEGAVYEGKREYPRAVDEYLKGALAGQAGTSRSRLLELARRPSTRDLVDQATAKAAAGANPSADALDLRIAVLQAQNRPKDLEALLASMAATATSFDLLEHIEGIAQQQGFDKVQQQALERRAALTTDPVDRLHLRFTLARYYEGKKDMASAQRNIDSIYSENPAILGVVRATVDFYWRNKQPDRAIAVLLEAAGRAYPALKKQFLFEAARKATEAAKYEQARQLLTGLLADSPYDAEYLAAMADTYARAGDDPGLRDFYLAKIQAFRQAPLSKDEQTARIAALRRGLILALTRMKQPDAAVDQYIEIINKYPEDDSLTTEAALYAIKYNLKDKLFSYYSKTASDSPKDYHWPMVLARLQVQFEDYPAAIEAYARASNIRPDRVDLHSSRAALEERLMRFDDAAADYQKIYDLAYHDPQWMLNLAEVRARQGQTAEVVKALRRALVEGRPERPQNYFAVAQRLENWNLLEPAREFAERGLDLARDDLLADPADSSGVLLYARVMTRLRKQEAAYARLVEANKAVSTPSASVFSTVTQGKYTEGHEKTAAAPPEQVVKKAQDTRRAENAHASLQAALKQMGVTVDKYFTPEEKASFAAFLDKQKAAASQDELADFLIPLAQSAGLADQEARWRDEVLLAGVGVRNDSYVQYSRLVELQKRRTRFDELGAQMELYFARLPRRPLNTGPLAEAAHAYRAAGNPGSELRLLSQIDALTGISGLDQERYFELLLARDPQRLVKIAGTSPWNQERDAAVQYVVAHGDAKLAQAAIASRAASRKVIWGKAYAALAGLYFSDTDPAVGQAFTGALGTMVIGERLGKTVDRDQQLAGDIWFYYGSRFGEYLGISKGGDPEDYLAAELEHTPGRAGAYQSLAEYYEDKGDLDRALADYAHALELQPSSGQVHDRMAVVLWKQGKRDEAVAHWKEAIAAFRRQQDSGRTAASFWSQVRRTLEHIGQRKLLPQVRDDADRMLRDYIRRNGPYQVEPLLRGAMKASGDPAAGVAWILDLAHAAPNEWEFLRDLATARWIPQAQREPILLRMLQLAQEAADQKRGEEQVYAHSSLQEWQLKWVAYLLETRQTERAQAALDGLPDETRKAQEHELAVLAIEIAAQGGRLDALLQRYRSDPDKMPASEDLKKAATWLAGAKDQASADKLLEIVYTRNIEAHDLTAANFLGLAEIKLNQNDVPGALALLRRMVLVTGSGFDGLPSASALLARKGHAKEAADFLADYVKATPWDTAARVQLAVLRGEAGQDVEGSQKALAAAAAAAELPYATRVSAALAFAKAKGTGLNPGSGELVLLGRGTPVTPAEAQQPFYFQAREEAAEQSKDRATQIRLLREALELRPNGDEARPLLLRAALDAGRNELAVGVVEPVLGGGGFRAYVPREEAPQAQEETEADSEPDTEAEAPSEEEAGAEAAAPVAPAEQQEYLYGRERFLAGGAFTPAQQARLAAGLARAYDKLNQLNAAQERYKQAISLETDTATRTALRKSLAAVQARITRQKRNQGRAPIIQDALEQDRIVRPRLVTQARPAPAPRKPAAARPGGAL